MFLYLFLLDEILRLYDKKKRAKYFILKILSSFYCTQTRGRTGMDFTPLVFETSASTDSAIWATVFLNCDAKVMLFFELANIGIDFFNILILFVVL